MTTMPIRTSSSVTHAARQIPIAKAHSLIGARIMAVNAKRYMAVDGHIIALPHGREPFNGKRVEVVLASDYQDMWDTALKRYNTIQRLEGEIEHLEGLLKQWAGNCTGMHGSQNRCGLLPADFTNDAGVKP